MSDANSAGEHLEQTVEVLEQILEVMPDDLVTLRSLYEACLKLGDPEKALDALGRLDDGARAAQDAAVIDFVLNQYAMIADESPEVRGKIERLKEVQALMGLLDDASDSSSVPSVPKGGSLEPEMALAWELFQDEQLTQEEYSSVLHDLTEMSSRSMGVPVSVLHILHDRQFSRFERVMTHLCQKSEVPIIGLGQFEDSESLAEVLPIDFSSKFGAIPFAEVSDELLLAVVNPFDKELVERAEMLCGRRCHPYLVTPHDYDQLLDKFKKELNPA